MRIAIAVFEGAEELDFAGPWEVLGAWAEYFDDGVTLRLAGESTAPVRCRKGLRVIPDATLSDTETADLVVVPGGQGARRAAASEDIVNWVRNHAARGNLVTSVCTGALVLAAAGLLDGRPATTHWAAIDDLRAHGVEVHPEARVVDDGDVLTCGGVTSGLDLALHLVECELGEEAATFAARLLEHQRSGEVFVSATAR
jgi:transcriptional regulator GlxA family with amidase domain